MPAPRQRNDSDIALCASNALAWQMHIPLDAVTVMIERGYVTLSGAVDGETQRQSAVEAVRRLAGVTGVSNKIAIRTMVPPRAN